MTAQVRDTDAEAGRIRGRDLVRCRGDHPRPGTRESNRRDHQRRERERPRVDEERQRHRDREEHGPERDADEIAHRVLCGVQRAVRPGEEIGRGFLGHDRTRGHVEEERADPDAHRHEVGEGESADPTHQEERGHQDDDEAPHVHGDQQAPAVDPVDGARAGQAEGQGRDVVGGEHGGDGDRIGGRGRGQEADGRDRDPVADARDGVGPPEPVERPAEAGSGRRGATRSGAFTPRPPQPDAHLALRVPAAPRCRFWVAELSTGGSPHLSGPVPSARSRVRCARGRPPPFGPSGAPRSWLADDEVHHG